MDSDKLAVQTEGGKEDVLHVHAPSGVPEALFSVGIAQQPTLQFPPGKHGVIISDGRAMVAGTFLVQYV